MKVVAINSSPRKDKGNTAMILNPFLEGIKEKGAEVEVYYTNDIEIKPCRGDCSCMGTTGKCFQEDDMDWLLPRIKEADILVLASPLYCDGVTGPMKMFMDRLVPAIHLTMEIREGHLRHPARRDMNLEKVVLVSNCGFWEMDNFDPMVAHIKAFSKNINTEYAGEILRPHGPVFGKMLKENMSVNDIIKSAREAGCQLVENGKMSSETTKNISRPLMSRDAFLQMVNQALQK
jgi:Multimeric flavodoxin WrbA